MGVSVTITGAKRLETAVRRAVKASERSVDDEMQHLLQLNRRAILSGADPTGGRQRGNQAETVLDKHGRPPLYDTGTLANPAAWRRVKHARGIALRPPRGRVTALRVLRRRGYRTILDLQTRREAGRILDYWRQHWRRGL